MAHILFEPLIILFCIAVFIWAEPLCVLFFGAKFGPAAHVLRRREGGAWTRFYEAKSRLK